MRHQSTPKNGQKIWQTPSALLAFLNVHFFAGVICRERDSKDSKSNNIFHGHSFLLKRGKRDLRALSSSFAKSFGKYRFKCNRLCKYSILHLECVLLCFICHPISISLSWVRIFFAKRWWKYTFVMMVAVAASSKGKPYMMDWIRPAPTWMIGWCLCDNAAATAQWAGVNFNGTKGYSDEYVWLNGDDVRGLHS